MYAFAAMRAALPVAPRPAKAPVNHSLYKTELCKSFEESGTCRYGAKCQFAHGPHELRHFLRHPKYKTEVCRTYLTKGSCPYGRRCRFIHPAPEQPLLSSLRAEHDAQRGVVLTGDVLDADTGAVVQIRGGLPQIQAALQAAAAAAAQQLLQSGVGSSSSAGSGGSGAGALSAASVPVGHAPPHLHGLLLARHPGHVGTLHGPVGGAPVLPTAPAPAAGVEAARPIARISPPPASLRTWPYSAPGGPMVGASALDASLHVDLDEEASRLPIFKSLSLAD